MSVTLANAQGGTEQYDRSIPFTTSFDAYPGQFVYVSAQGKGYNASITCEILVGGESLKRSHSSGDFVIATCSSSVP